MRKLAMLLIALTLTMTVLVGCAKKDPVTDDKGNQSGTNSNVDDKENTEKVTLQLWHYISQGDLDDFEKIIDDFNTSQDRIEVVPTYVSRDDLTKQYTMGAISGELPDIGEADSPDFASFIELGVFEDITDMVNEWGEIDQFYEGPLSTVKDAEGRIYGLPHNSNSLLMFYNKDMLEDAGYTEAPKTWAELEEVAAKVTTSDTYGFSIAAAANETTTFHFYPWLYSTEETISSLDSEGAIGALEFLTNMLNNGYMSKEVINWGNGDVKEAFAAGKVAMMINGTWQVPSLREADLGFEWGVAEIPIDKQLATTIGGEDFGIGAGTKHKEEAFEFLAYMMNAQNNADFCEAGGKIPVRKDAMELKEVWSTDPIISVFAESLDYAIARGPHAEWPSISKAIQEAVHASFLGEKTPEVAMKEAADKVNAIINE
ncbi:MAG: ABC transporter substrate-binding protein [Anaerolineaceae bacterium]|nr:MAG: ABC transporter substrate-binding protein [Anaerolineaceae bacterium]